MSLIMISVNTYNSCSVYTNLESKVFVLVSVSENSLHFVQNNLFQFIRYFFQVYQKNCKICRPIQIRKNFGPFIRWIVIIFESILWCEMLTFSSFTLTNTPYRLTMVKATSPKKIRNVFWYFKEMWNELLSIMRILPAAKWHSRWELISLLIKSQRNTVGASFHRDNPNQKTEVNNGQKNILNLFLFVLIFFLINLIIPCTNFVTCV